MNSEKCSLLYDLKKGEKVAMIYDCIHRDISECHRSVIRDIIESKYQEFTEAKQ